MVDRIEDAAPEAHAAEAVSIDPSAPAGAAKWSVTGKFLGDHIDLSARRVRELAETGQLRRGAARGTYDWHSGILGHSGRTILGQERLRGLHHDTICAAGFLSAFTLKGGSPVTAADLAAWGATCARWGLPTDDAGALIASAAGILGDRAPKFETSSQGKN